MSLGDFFNKLWHGITGLFSKLNSDKAQKIVHDIFSIADQALPVVETVAKLTPNPTDDLVIAALKELNLTAEQVLDQTNDLLHNASRQALAVEILKQKLLGVIASGGSVKISDTIIDSAVEILSIPRDQLNSAITLAYSLWKRATS